MFDSESAFPNIYNPLSLTESFSLLISFIGVNVGIHSSVCHQSPCKSGFPGDPAVQNLPGVQSHRRHPLEEGMATHSSILIWKVPWTEEPGRLQSIGSQRVEHD